MHRKLVVITLLPNALLLLYPITTLITILPPPTHTHNSDRLQQLRVEIQEQQELARGKHFPAAFVTFNSRVSQVAASRSLITEDLSTWRCQPAPRPSEVVWGNLGWRTWERAGRRLLMLGAFVAMALFFMIPVAAVQAILSTNSLVR